MAEDEAGRLIAALGLEPHPEGGHYRETWRAPAAPGSRSAGTAIYFLLRAGERSAWHRIDSAEVWHFYAGAPLRLSIGGKDRVETVLLGPEIAAGEAPQAVVPPRAWQAAETTGAFTLVGCTVAPGFTFEGFELAPAGGLPIP